MEQRIAGTNTNRQAMVLVLDTSPENLVRLETILTSHGYQVRLSAESATGLALAREEGPDIVLLGTHLPEMDGYEVCRRLKHDQHTRDIPVIFISSLGAAAQVVAAFRSGAADYITRPFQAEEVVARVDNQVSFVRTRQALQRRIALEELITAISTRFINVTLEHIGPEIERSLADIGRFIEVNQCYLILLNQDGTAIASGYKWSNEQQGRIEQVRGASLAPFGWVMTRLRRLETINIPRLDDLPPEASAERELWRRQGQTSLLALPLAIGETLVGFMGFRSTHEERQWDQEDERLLSVIRDVFVNVVARQRAEVRLRQECGRSQTYLDIASVMFVALDRFGRVTLVNSKACEILGYATEEIIGKVWFDHFLPMSKRDEVRHIFGQLLDGQLEWVEYVESLVLVRSGEERTIAWHNTLVRDDLGVVVGILSSGTDITERKRAEARQATQLAVTRILATAETKAAALPRLLQAIGEGLDWQVGEWWQADDHAGVLRCTHGWHAPDFAETDFARLSPAITFVRGEGLQGRVWQSGAPAWIAEAPADPHFVRSAMAARAGLQATVVFPVGYHDHVDGVMSFFSRAIRPPDPPLSQMMSDVGSQISQFLKRKRAEVSFEVEHARFEWVVEHTDHGFVIVNEHDAIVYANQQARRYLHLSDAGAGQTFHFLDLACRHYNCHPEEAWEAWLQHSIAADPPGQRVLRYLVRPETHETQALWLMVERLDLPTTQGEQLICLHDVTRQMTTQRHMWTFHALISHKLNTPLSCLINSLYLLGEQLPGTLPESVQNFVTIALESAERLNQQIRSIRHFLTTPLLAQPGSECPLNRVPAIAQHLGQELGIERLHCSGFEQINGAYMVLSEQAVVLVLRQVLENTRKFHPRHAPEVEVSLCHRQEQRVCLCVGDDGASLTPEQLGQVWVPYYQVEKGFSGQVPGMGLGLAIVASLLWGVGGSYRIVNREPGPGVIVEMVVPLARLPSG